MALQVWLPLNGNIIDRGLAGATFTGTATYNANGKIGSCLASQIISTNTTVPTNITTASIYTMCSWVKTSSTSVWIWYVGGNTGGCRGLWVGAANTGPHFAYGGSGAFTGSTAINNNVWHHVCFTCNGTVSKAYVDGVYCGGSSSTQTNVAGTNGITVCGSSTCLINDFRIYDKVLSEREIKELSKGLTVHYPLSAGGQNNLIPGAMEMNTGWSYGGRASRSGTVGDFQQAVLTGSTDDWSALVAMTPIRYLLVRGMQTTFSFYAKASASVTAILERGVSRVASPAARQKYITTNVTIGTEWKRYTVTETLNDSFFTQDSVTNDTIVPATDYVRYKLYCHVNSVTIYTYGWKLEYGSIATPWRPHPKDNQFMAMGMFTGNKNLLLDSRKDENLSHTTYNVQDFNLSESLVANKTYVISARINFSSDKKSYGFYLSGGSVGLDVSPWHLLAASDGYCVGIFTATSANASDTTGAGHGFIRVYVSNVANAYQGSTAVTGTANVKWIKLEEGNIATGWTPNESDSGYSGRMIEYDTSGFGYNAVRYGGIRVSSDTARYSSSYEFYNPYRTRIAVGIIWVRDEITYNWWAYMSDWSQYNGAMVCSVEGSGLGIQNSSNKLWCICGTGESSNNYGNGYTMPAPSAGWHMFTLTWDGLSFKVYLDATLKFTDTRYSTKTPLYVTSGTYLFLGGESAGNATVPGDYWTGKLSDFRLYATALSSTDILDLYQTGASVASNGAILANEFVE